MENKTYKLSTGLTVKQSRLTVRKVYEILKLLKSVKSELKVSLTDLENIDFEQIVDAITQSDLIAAFLKIILTPAPPIEPGELENYDDVELDDAFVEVIHDFFTINKALPKILTLIKNQLV